MLDDAIDKLMALGFEVSWSDFGLIWVGPNEMTQMQVIHFACRHSVED